MNLFLDNNVLIGYIFETDYWNSNSLKVITGDFNKYSSDTVQNECQYKYTSSLRKLKNELNRFKKQIRVSKSFNDLELFLHSTRFKTKDILLDFLKSNTSVSISDILNKFTNLQWAVESLCRRNYNHLSQVIHYHKRNKPHKELYSLCVSDDFVTDDADDVEIVIDAHDLGLDIENLSIVTGDYKHIVSRKQFIVENTSIYDVIGLGQFTPT